MEILPQRGAGSGGPQRGLYLIIGALVVALLLALWALSTRKPAASRPAARGSQLDGLQSEEPGEQDSADPEDRFMARSEGLEDDDDLSFGDMLDVLGAEVSKPEVRAVAKPFARDFRSDPVLRAAFQDAADQERSGKRLSASEFLDRMGRLPQFHALVERYGDAATTSALLALYQAPNLRRFWKKQTRSPSNNPLVARAMALAKARGLSLSGPAARPAGWLAAMPGAGDGAVIPTSSVADTIVSTAGAQSGSGPNAGGGGAGGHDVQASLAPIKAATSDAMTAFCAPENFKWLCDGVDPAERVAIYNAIGIHGLWGACFYLNLYPRCLSACQSSSGKCAPVTAWNACMEYADQDEVRCLSLCNSARFCRVPKEAWDEHCKGAPPPSPCTTGVGISVVKKSGGPGCPATEIFPQCPAGAEPLGEVSCRANCDDGTGKNPWCYNCGPEGGGWCHRVAGGWSDTNACDNVYAECFRVCRAP